MSLRIETRHRSGGNKNRIPVVAIATTFLFSLLPVEVAGAKELLEVYRHALDNNAELQAAAHARAVDLLAQPLARAALLPQVGLNLDHNRSKVDSQATNSVIDTTTGQPVAGGVKNRTETQTSTLAVTLGQSLYDRAAILRYRQASSRASLAEATYRSAEQDLLLRIAQAYFNLLAATDGLEFAKAENKAVERQLYQATRRLDVGLAIAADAQEAQAAFDLTRAQVLQAEQTLENAQQTLREITATSGAKPVPLREQFDMPSPLPDNVERWVERALLDNYELVGFQLGSRIARQELDIVSSARLPTVNLAANYTGSNIDSDSRVGHNERENRGLGVGLSLRVPLFTGGLLSAQSEQAHARLDQREAEALGAKRRVERQTRAAYLGVISGAEQVRALHQAVLSGSTSVTANERGLIAGTRTTVDVLNAQRDLFNARRNHAAARYNYLLSILALKAAAGALDEAALAEIDALLADV